MLSHAHRAGKERYVSDEIGGDVQAELAKRGHQLTVKATPIAVPSMLFIDSDSGLFYAAGDPKTGRHAAGVAGEQ